MKHVLFWINVALIWTFLAVVLAGCWSAFRCGIGLIPLQRKKLFGGICKRRGYHFSTKPYDTESYLCCGGIFGWYRCKCGAGPWIVHAEDKLPESVVWSE